MDRKEQAWVDAMIGNGHVPQMDEDGSLDIFVCDNDYHNGPGCAECSDNWCWHCDDPSVVGPCPAPQERQEEAEIAVAENVCGDGI